MADHKTGYDADLYSSYTRRILRILSTDSRATLSEISKSLGISRKNAKLRLKNIEKKFKISYTLELDAGKLGLIEPHLIIVRFKRRPDYPKIKSMLAESPVTQFAAVTKGQYGLLIYANAFSRSEYYYWNWAMRNKLLPAYAAAWEESEIAYQRLGFFPLRSEVFEGSVLGEKDKTILKILNYNSRMPLSDLARAVGMNYKSVAYHLKRLVAEGYIRRFTISIGARKDALHVGLFGRFIPSDDIAAVAKITKAMFTSDEPEPLISRYLATAALVGSYGFFVLGAFKNYHRAYVDFVLRYKKAYKRFGNTKTVHASVKKVLLGRLPVRNVDNKSVYRDTV